MKTKLVALDGYTLNPGDNPWEPVAALGDLRVYPTTLPAEVIGRIAEAEVIITNKTGISAEIIAASPKLKFIAVTATGYNVVDIAAARERGIAASNVPEYGTYAVAQFTFALLLELCHHVGLHDRAVRQGAWARSGQFTFWQTPLIELQGLTLGIIGYGRIGRQTARIGAAMGMKIIVAALSPAAGAAGPDQPERLRLTEVFERADVVSLHCPLTPQTMGMVHRDLLRRMKPSAFLINTARGALIVESDLAEALKNGWLAGAGLDVVSAEPIQPDNPLLSAPNCLITPHIAWAAAAARRRLMRATAENIAAFLRGHPINVVNAAAM